jgi:hypothetical protein
MTEFEKSAFLGIDGELLLTLRNRVMGFADASRPMDLHRLSFLTNS